MTKKQHKRLPNRTKEEKLADIDKRIQFHQTSIESINRQLETLQRKLELHNVQMKKLQVTRENTEKCQSKESKAKMMESICNRLKTGEPLSNEEMLQMGQILESLSPKRK
jgi:uncharacterized coiled-coil DUF342 family protein